jgi:hypothetical protein
MVSKEREKLEQNTLTVVQSSFSRSLSREGPVYGDQLTLFMTSVRIYPSYEVGIIESNAKTTRRIT